MSTMEETVSEERSDEIKAFVEGIEDAEEAYFLVKLAHAKWLKHMEDVEKAFAECQALYTLDDENTAMQEEYMYDPPGRSVDGVISSNITIPDGFDGYHVTHKKFIKWIESSRGLVNKRIINGKVAKLSKCGYWGMEVSDSNQFNINHDANQKLVLKDSKFKSNTNSTSDAAVDHMET